MGDELEGGMRMQVKNTFLHFCFEKRSHRRSLSAFAVMTRTTLRQRKIPSDVSGILLSAALGKTQQEAQRRQLAE